MLVFINQSVYFIYYHSADASNFFAAFGYRDNPDLIGSIDCPPYAYGFSECTLDSIDAEDCPPNQDLYIYCSRCKSCDYINKYYIW